MNYSSLIAIGSIVLSAASFAAAMNINSNTALNQDLNEPLIITADGVTVDLNGHSINCTGDAIQISGRSNVTILSTYEMAEVGASSTSTGIRVVNSRDISISHIWVHDRNNGVSVENSQRVYISDVNSANNTRDGFSV